MISHRLTHTVVAVIGVVALATLIVGEPVWAEGESRGYRFTQAVKLGDCLPSGGGCFFGDFEVTGLNEHGDLTFISELNESFHEGVFSVRDGVLSAIARPFDLAPGGTTIGCPGVGSGIAGATSNHAGDVAFASFPGCDDRGIIFRGGNVYRYRHGHQELEAVMLSDKTRVPGGGVFRGVYFDTDIAKDGTVAFTGLIDTELAPGGTHFGIGVYTADSHNRISKVAAPGDPAPGGGTFDVARNPGINDRGDVAFGGHVTGEECVNGFEHLCDESIYLRRASDGVIESIAHQGEAAPGTGGMKYRIAFGASLNKGGDLVFTGVLTPSPPASGDEYRTIFSRIEGVTAPVVLRGDTMPGGGHFLTTSFFIPPSYGITDDGDVYFGAVLDSDDDGNGIPDTGFYVRDRHGLRVIVRTGDVLPGIGTVADVAGGDNIGLFGVRMNKRGQVAVPAHLANGDTIILLGTPLRGPHDDDDHDD